ncbi:MAG: thioredoxin family protein [Acidobacteria bacterium]|nr:thioredoxin family protein [Acidobacteriota bacterium]
MALIASADQDVLRESFAEMTRPVRLLFFTQTLDCPTCLPTRQILDELPVLSDKITVEEVNFVLDKDRVALYGIDRVPAVAVVYEEAGALLDSRMRFLGTPAGYEFVSLVQAVLLAGGRPSRLAPDSRAALAALDRPLTMRVFTTPTCPHCPRAVALAHEMAFASPQVTAYAIEATEFPDLARRYQVSGVPKTVVNDQVEILGAIPEPDFVAQALAEPPPAA